MIVRVLMMWEFYMEWFSSCPGSPRFRSFDPWSRIASAEERFRAGVAADIAELDARIASRMTTGSEVVLDGPRVATV